MRLLGYPALFCALFCVFIQNSGSQTKPSERIPEGKVRAGESITIPITLDQPSTQPFNLTLTYRRVPPLATGWDSFQCNSYNVQGQAEVNLACQTNRQNIPGIYKPFEDSFGITRTDSGDHKSIPLPQDLPYYEIVANPYAPTVFPNVVGARPRLDINQSFFDGAARADEILKELSEHFSITTRDTPENRAYLVSRIQFAKTLVDLTRRRFATAGGNVASTPMFEDFDRRLDLVSLSLSGKVTLERRREVPQMVLASFQRPHTNDTVSAQAQKDSKESVFSDAIGDLYKQLKEMAKGWAGISEDGDLSFKWSAASIPTKADVYIQRLGLPETKLAGMTDFKDQKLPYALWTFRFDWNGCSKSETPDPYLQKPIDMQELKAGCTIK